MAKIGEHCADCIQILGEEFKEVHLWLDEFFPALGPKHRSRRHHQDAVEEIRQRWGDKAAKAAVIHIMKDCHGKVPTKREATLSGLFS